MRAPVTGERWEARRLLAILTAFAVAAAMFVLYSGTARADHVSTLPHSSAANLASFWEQWGADNEGEDDWECSKIDRESLSGYTLEEPPSGYVWRLLVTKKGAGDGANELHWNPVPGQSYQHSGGGFSHLILCMRPVVVETTTTTVEETTTTSVDDTTTTSVDDTTTTSVDDTTTTSVDDTTTTSVDDTTTTTEENTTTSEVLPTRFACDEQTQLVVEVESGDEGYDDAYETEIEAAEAEECQEVLPTVVTTAPEVDPEEELPFTGIDTDVMIGLSAFFLALGAVLLTLTRRLEEN